MEWILTGAIQHKLKGPAQNCLLISKKSCFCILSFPGSGQVPVSPNNQNLNALRSMSVRCGACNVIQGNMGNGNTRFTQR